MNQKLLLRRVFPIIAILLLAPWPAAYAHDAGTTPSVQETVAITVAGPSAQPNWSAFGGAVGGVTAGDLFYIDATGSPADVSATLHLTNARDLIHSYRYLILKVGLYHQAADGDWHKVTECRDKPAPDAFLTLGNGQVSFTLTGRTKYRVTIDSGSFYSYPVTPGKGNSPPSFYLEIDQLETAKGSA